MNYLLLFRIIIFFVAIPVIFFLLISSTLSCSSNSSILYPETVRAPKQVNWDLDDPYHCEELYSTVVEYEEYVVEYMKEDKRYRENIPEEEARKRRYLNEVILKYYDKCWDYVYDREGLDM